MIRGWFELDVRSLAVFRMMLALGLLWDLAVRARSLEAHYANAGILPLDVWRAGYHKPGEWSLHALSGGIALQAGLFAVAAMAALALLVGWRTRVATVVSWVLLASVHNRCGPLLNSGDDLFRLLLFWSMFLPLGRWGSADAEGGPVSERRVFSTATVGLVVQVVLVYWTVMIVRVGIPEWTVRFDALWVALNFDAYTTRMGVLFRDHAGFLLGPLTLLAGLIEAFGPLLAFSPWRGPELRTAAVALFLVLHLAFGALMEVGLFWWVSSASWVVLLPAWAWDRLPALGPTPGSGQVPPPGWLASAPPVFALVAILAVCGRTMVDAHATVPAWPAPVSRCIEFFRLDQNWVVYSPPPRADGWPVIKGILADGRAVDLFTGADPATEARPAHIADVYRDQRWRHALYPLATKKRARMRPSIARHLARAWERAHPGDRVERVEMFYLRETTGRRAVQPLEREVIGAFPLSLQDVREVPPPG